MGILIKIIVTLIFSVFGAILYRIGGAKGYDTKFRDLGTPLCGIIILLIWWQPVKLGWLLLMPHFGLAFASMTTYWDKLFSEDNFYMHGFMAGLASFPLFWAGIHWYAILISAVVCGLLMGWWSKKEGNDVKEELGRGLVYCLTRLCLLI